MTGTDSEASGDVYEVEAIVGRRIKGGGVQYLLKWKGYDERTWTKAEECDSCKDMVAKFESENTPGATAAAVTSRSGRSIKQTQRAAEASPMRSSGRSATRPNYKLPSPVSDAISPEDSDAEESILAMATTPTGGSAKRKPRSANRISRDLRDSSNSSSEEPSTSSSTRKQKRSGGKAKPTNEESDEEEKEEAPTSSRASAGKKGLAKSSGSPGKKSPKKQQPAKRGRKSNGSAKEESGSDSEEDSKKVGAVKKRKVEQTRRSPIARKPVNVALDEPTPEPEAPARRGRGRPSKASKAAESSDDEMETSARRGRGRPSKASKAAESSDDEMETSARRGRGRPRKSAANEYSDDEMDERRSSKSPGKKTAVRRAPVAEDSDSDEEEEEKPKKVVKEDKKRSSRGKVAKSPRTTSQSSSTMDATTSGAQNGTNGTRFPSGPSSQFANGVTIPGGIKRHLNLCADAASAKWEKPKRDKILSLDEILAATIAEAPFVLPVDWDVSSSQPVRPRGSAAASSYDAARFRTPLKFFKPMDLPGVDVWTFDSYEESGEYEATKKDGIEMFRDREVERVVGYVTHPSDPFVLVKLAQKKNEKEMLVRDLVLAVHCHLAVFLFPQKFVDYTGRLIKMSTDYKMEDNPFDRAPDVDFV